MKEKLELGDGEPSYCTDTGHTFPPNPPNVKLTFGEPSPPPHHLSRQLRSGLSESGAAQEVSPPSPEPKKPGTWPDKCLQRAFVDGASWWEWHKEKATMWQSDRKLAEAEAVRMYGKPTELGDTRELKAALTNLVARLKIVMAWPEPHFSHDLPIEIRAELAEAEKLLG